AATFSPVEPLRPAPRRFANRPCLHIRRAPKHRGNDWEAARLLSELAGSFRDRGAREWASQDCPDDLPKSRLLADDEACGGLHSLPRAAATAPTHSSRNGLDARTNWSAPAEPHPRARPGCRRLIWQSSAAGANAPRQLVQTALIHPVGPIRCSSGGSLFAGGLPVGRTAFAAVAAGPLDLAGDRVAFDLALVAGRDLIAIALANDLEGQFVVFQLGVLDLDFAVVGTIDRAGDLVSIDLEGEGVLHLIAISASRSPGPLAGHVRLICGLKGRGH